jgi:hypothetical protein
LRGGLPVGRPGQPGVTMPAGPRPCLRCRERLARRRGVCDPCYRRLLRAVKARETTWGQLQAEGSSLPARKRGAGWWWGFRGSPRKP